MVRTQIVALSLGAGLAAVIGGVLVYQGLLPGAVPQPSHSVAPTPQAVTVPAGKPAAAPAQTQAMSAAKAPTAAPAQGKPSSSALLPNPAPSSAPSSSPSPPPNPSASPAASASSKSVTEPLPKQPPATAGTAPSAPAVVPQFDTVRVEPSGESVVAGHGPANRKVALLAGEKVIGDAQTEDSGDFVIVPEPLAPGNYVLSLRSGTLRSRQSVMVSVPAKGKKGVVVALDEPGRPSVLLADPTAPSETAPKPAASREPAAKAAEKINPVIAFKTAEVDKGGFYASGSAPSGTHVRIYLNGSALADVIADSKGQWSLTIGKGMTAGHYVVRADALGASGKVIARAEVPFDVPVVVAEDNAPATAVHKPATPSHPGPVASLATRQPKEPARAPKAEVVKPESAAEDAAGDSDAKSAKARAAAATPKPAETAPAADASHAVVVEVNTAKVVPGDSLWRISRETLGHGVRYTLIYQANASQIRNPNLIYPGQVFVVPHVD